MRADSCNLPGTLLHDFITVFASRKEENEEVICHIRSAKMLGKSALTKKHKKQKEKILKIQSLGAKHSIFSWDSDLYSATPRQPAEGGRWPGEGGDGGEAGCVKLSPGFHH